MDNGKFLILACMGVGVFKGGHAVGRPTGVTYADSPAHIFAVIGLIHKVFNALGGLFDFKTAVKHRYSRRVIAPVFKPFKAVKQKARRLCLTCKYNYQKNICNKLKAE